MVHGLILDRTNEFFIKELNKESIEHVLDEELNIDDIEKDIWLNVYHSFL